jgi:hypothetical protein
MVFCILIGDVAEYHSELDLHGYAIQIEPVKDYTHPRAFRANPACQIFVM